MSPHIISTFWFKHNNPRKLTLKWSREYFMEIECYAITVSVTAVWKYFSTGSESIAVSHNKTNEAAAGPPRPSIYSSTACRGEGVYPRYPPFSTFLSTCWRLRHWRRSRGRSLLLTFRSPTSTQTWHALQARLAERAAVGLAFCVRTSEATWASPRRPDACSYSDSWGRIWDKGRTRTVKGAFSCELAYYTCSH